MAGRNGKRIRGLREQAGDPAAAVAIEEAAARVKKGATAKFDETVEVAVRLGVDPRKSDQAVRGVAAMPSGTGRETKVAVFCDDGRASDAEKSGADIAGMQKVTELLDKGEHPFDILIAEPAAMSQLGKYGKQLGPKGLMPNPKSGTVTNDLDGAIKRAKAGQVSYRTEKGGIVHAAIGKSSFSEEDLVANFNALIDSLKRSKPAASKGQYLVGAKLSSTMGPSVPVDLAPLR